MIFIQKSLATALVMVIAQAAQAQDSPQASPSATAGKGCTEVDVHNVRPQQGLLMVAAYTNAADFGKQPSTALRLKAEGAVMRFQLCGLSGQTVALMLYQDLDSDGKMSRNPVGMPTEPWGGSGTPGPFGPTWETAQVPLDGKLILVSMSD